MSFTNRQQFVATDENVATFKNIRKRWNCALCGLVFEKGHKVRWIYCNSTPNQRTGNFFVCGECDDTDDNCRAKGKAILEQAVKLAKQWGIYGPDWRQS